MYLNNHLNTCTMEKSNEETYIQFFQKGNGVDCWKSDKISYFSYVLLRVYEIAILNGMLFHKCHICKFWAFDGIPDAFLEQWSSQMSHHTHCMQFTAGCIIFLCFFSSFFPSTLLSQRLHLSNSFLSESTNLLLNAQGSNNLRLFFN